MEPQGLQGTQFEKYTLQHGSMLVDDPKAISNCKKKEKNKGEIENSDEVILKIII